MCIENEWLNINFRRKCIPILTFSSSWSPRSSDSHKASVLNCFIFQKLYFLAFNNVCMQFTSCIVHCFVFYFFKCDQSTFKKIAEAFLITFQCTMQFDFHILCDIFLIHSLSEKFFLTFLEMHHKNVCFFVSVFILFTSFHQF